MQNEEVTSPTPEVNTAPDSTETTEIVTPEPEQTSESKPPERDKRDDTIARMRGRINQKHAEAAAANERARMFEEQLAKAKPAGERVEVDPDEIEKIVRTRASEIARAERLNERCNAVAEKGRTDFPDFADALAVMRDELPLFDKNNGATPALEAILEMDNPPALIHYLGKNPDIASELADLSPIQLTRRLDKIERELKPTRQPSSAPKPLEPVRSSASPGEPDPKDTAKWIAWRNKQTART